LEAITTYLSKGAAGRKKKYVPSPFFSSQAQGRTGELTTVQLKITDQDIPALPRFFQHMAPISCADVSTGFELDSFY
jgi:hypothetical protein